MKIVNEFKIWFSKDSVNRCNASLDVTRLRSVPQDGHASEEIERGERKLKTRSRGEAGEEAGKEVTKENAVSLLPASLQFPSRPFRSLKSCRA